MAGRTSLLEEGKQKSESRQTQCMKGERPSTFGSAFHLSRVCVCVHACAHLCVHECVNG